jgi:hypothetical protein
MSANADPRPGPGLGPSMTGEKGPHRGAAAATIAVAVVIGALGSCARQGIPPGGPRDNLPPEVVSTRPDTFAEIDRLDGPIRIQFGERISERPVGTSRLDDAVLVSPRGGAVRVRHRRDALEIELSGGVRPGVVYRVTLLPVIQDLFNNAMEAPFEFLFSTGGEYYPNAVAGMVVDRITGLSLEGADVAARPDWTDTLDLVYVSRTDASGIFALRSMPPGRYRVQAFQDRDLDHEPDPFEVQGERLVFLNMGDTILNADLLVLEPDTLPARLATAVLADSTRVRLTFDDYLDPLASPGAVTVALEPRPDTTEEGIQMPPPPPVVREVIHEHQFAAWQDSVNALAELADSLAIVARRDSAAAVGDSVEMAAADSMLATLSAGRQAASSRVPGQGGNVARPPSQGPRSLLDGTPLPAQSLIAVLGEPIPAGSAYYVRVDSVVNINGLGGGSGEAVLRREAAPAVPDSAAAAGDSTQIAPPDSIPPPPGQGPEPSEEP